MNAPQTASNFHYRHPVNGKTWDGVGKEPKWVRDYLATGATLEPIENTPEAAIEINEAAIASIKASEKRDIPVRSIVASPTNPRRRFTAEAMEGLTKSIAKHGVIQPILVRPIPQALVLKLRTLHGQYELVCGERRWQGSKAAGLETIPAMVRDLTDEEVLELQTLENLQRENLHPIEEAEGFQRLMELPGYSAEKIGEQVGKSKGYVYAALKLLALCPQVRELFFEGKLEASTALLIARIPVPALQVECAQECTNPRRWGNEPYSFREAKEHIKDRYQLNLDRAPFSGEDAALLPAAGACTSCPKRAGNAAEDFPDTPVNVCTDPNCYAAKKAALAERTRQAAEAEGQKIITGDAARELLPNMWATRVKGMIMLDQECQDIPYGNGGRPSYRKLLGDQVTPEAIVKIEKEGGGYCECVERTDAIKDALKAAIHAAGAVTTREAGAAERQRQDIAVAFRHQLFAECRAQTPLLLAHAELLLLARASWDRLGYQTRCAVARYWLTAAKEHEAVKALEEDIPDMRDHELIRLLLDIALSAELPDGEVTRDPQKLMAEATRQGLDPERIRKEATASATKPAKKTAPAKKAA